MSSLDQVLSFSESDDERCRGRGFDARFDKPTSVGFIGESTSENTLDLNYSLYFWLLRRHVRVYNHVLKCMQVRSQDFLRGGGS